MKKAVLITGSDGLIGSESAYFFSKLDYKIIGIDWPKNSSITISCGSSFLKFFRQDLIAKKE